jgi:transketolase
MNPNKLRKHVLEMVYRAQSGHIGGSFSLAEVIAFLFNNFDVTGRDKIILSKGHAVPIIYAALHEKGIISKKELLTFREINSRLQGHPVHWLIPEPP